MHEHFYMQESFYNQTIDHGHFTCELNYPPPTHSWSPFSNFTHVPWYILGQQSTFSPKSKFQSLTKEKPYLSSSCLPSAVKGSSRPRAVYRHPNPNPLSNSLGLLPSPWLHLSGRPVPANSPSLRSPRRSSVPRRVSVGGGAGTGRWEARTPQVATVQSSRASREHQAVRRQAATSSRAVGSTATTSRPVGVFPLLKSFLAPPLILCYL
jgi:hypothetical protein